MKTLKESILGDIDTNVDKMDSDIEQLSKFGYRFKVVSGNGLDTLGIGMFSIKSLRKHTINLQAIDEDPVRGIWSRKKIDNEKVQLFMKWLNNLDLSPLGNFDSEDNSFRKELQSLLNTKVTEFEIFNNNRADIHVPSNAATQHGELKIMIMDKRPGHWKECMQFRFIVRK